VSTASASRALSRPEAVSDELKAKISGAAKAVGYIPNSAARALVRRRSGLIGIVTGALDAPVTALALNAFQSQLASAGWGLLWSNGGNDRRTLEAVQSLVSRDVEAIVLLGIAIPAELEGVRGIRRLPCVSVDRAGAAGVTAHVGVDLAGSARLIAEYLGQLGHRRLAVVAEPDSIIGALLVEGLTAQLATPLEVLTLGASSVAEGVLQWSALADPPTAAICSSDMVALAVIDACARHRIDVPGKMSVIGFGDSALARFTTPAMTSVRVPAHRAGIAAAEYLLAHLAGGAPIADVLPVKIAVRASTGPRGSG
jgi:LacI family transcriptional regulator